MRFGSFLDARLSIRKEYSKMSSELDTPVFEVATDHKKVRGSVISLLRGFFSSPTIAALAELGLIERMLAGPFRVEDFPIAVNKPVLSSVFLYLHSLNLLKGMPDGGYALTDQGRTALKRNGAFLLLFSYRGYFENLAGLLTGDSEAVTVDRRRNVLGSGSLHSKKFFPAVWEMFNGARPSALIDVGCGDGQFLTDACTEWPDVSIAAVDLSPIAVETTLKRLETSGRRDVVGIVESGINVADWTAHLPEGLKAESPLVVSMWFVVHEYSGSDPKTVIRFFQQVRSALPKAEIILGEINALPPELLAEHHESSIMPELLLFHDLSRQGVLTWETWQHVLDEIPYSLIEERQFDLVGEVGEQTTPSSFVWRLRPK
jgi:2-ketoarginine methyltransferase